MITLVNLFSYIGWQDLIEIITLSTIFYYVSLWLKRDSRNKLLIYFYGYCLLVLTSFLLDLPVLFSFLSYYAPVIAMLFILLHQETLQKQFISLRTYTPARQLSIDWYNELIRCVLINRNKGIPLHIIIEHKDNLEELLDAPFTINAHFQLDLLQALIRSEIFDQEKFIWIRSNGTIVSINASLHHQPDSIFKKDTVKDLSAWQQDAIALSNKTDAITVASDEVSTGFTMIIQGSIATQIGVENSLKILKKHMMHRSYKGTSHYEQTKSQEKQESSS